MTEQVETVWTGGAEGHVGRIWGKKPNFSQVRPGSLATAFVRICCQQTIDQLTAEKKAIEEAVVR